LGAYLELAHPVKVQSILEAFKKVFGESKAHLITLNESALERGANYIKGLRS
jgi:2-oxoglutarate ferredoxin oxidoreductase subunit gamma